MTKPEVVAVAPAGRVAGMREGRVWLMALAALYLALAGIFATTPLDIDEFTFVREPYELLGGDYTLGYLRQHEVGAAVRTALKSYRFFWTYRPLNAPVIAAADKSRFAAEEKTFGYVRPDAVRFGDPASVQKYRARLVVPEPDRFYSHGAGKPLLPAILSIPQMALLKALNVSADRFLGAQYAGHLDWLFLVMRLAQLLAGLASLLLVYRILEMMQGAGRARLGALVFALFPVTVKYFPNLHHDSILVPFCLLAVFHWLRGRNLAAGLAYGLALASKNLAIVLAPVFLLDVGWAAVSAFRADGRRAALDVLRGRLGGLAVTGAVALAVLLPFANPVSYVEEILTPVMARPVDPRGENVAQWTVKAMAGAVQPLSPPVSLVQKFGYFNDIGFLFLVLAMALAVQKKPGRAGTLSLAVLAVYLPLSSVFGVQLTYRTLLLVPFFCIAAAELLTLAQLRALAAGCCVLTMAYVADPGRTDLIHNRGAATARE